MSVIGSIFSPYSISFAIIIWKSIYFLCTRGYIWKKYNFKELPWCFYTGPWRSSKCLEDMCIWSTSFKFISAKFAQFLNALQSSTCLINQPSEYNWCWKRLFGSNNYSWVILVSCPFLPRYSSRATCPPFISSQCGLWLKHYVSMLEAKSRIRKLEWFFQSFSARHWCPWISLVLQLLLFFPSSKQTC